MNKSNILQILFCLLSPAIFAQLHKIKDPNNEPFLPIHPVYPYSPKLIKRGTKAESTLQLTPETPKIDAKDSYSSNYNNNQQRDSYYPNYDPYSKSNSPSSAHPSHNSDVHPYANLPYVTYPTQYAVNPASYPSPPYLNYYYQPPYYYPHYFNQASHSPLPTPSTGIGYQETSQDSTEMAENDKQNRNKQFTQSKENENQDASTSQFVDNGNYISNNLRDLDGQSNTYKLTSPYNQLDAQAKGPPIFVPRTTYRLVNVAEQPVGQDYSLPAPYVKVQQTEQLMANLLPQKQAGQSYENNRNVLNSANDGSYANQDAYTPNTPSYRTLSGAKTKTGVTFVINVDDTAKVNGERTNLRDAPFQKTSNKNTRYSSHYVQKPVSQLTHTSSDSRNKHRDRVIDRRPTNHRYDYDNYDSTYDQSSNKQEQNYRNDQNQSGSYQNKDFIVVSQTPQSYNYQYSTYELGKAQQMQQDTITPDDGNFGNKEYNKK